MHWIKNEEIIFSFTRQIRDVLENHKIEEINKNVEQIVNQIEGNNDIFFKIKINNNKNEKILHVLDISKLQNKNEKILNILKWIKEIVSLQNEEKENIIELKNILTYIWNFEEIEKIILSYANLIKNQSNYIDEKVTFINQDFIDGSLKFLNNILSVFPLLTIKNNYKKNVSFIIGPNGSGKTNFICNLSRQIYNDNNKNGIFDNRQIGIIAANSVFDERKNTLYSFHDFRESNTEKIPIFLTEINSKQKNNEINQVINFHFYKTKENIVDVTFKESILNKTLVKWTNFFNNNIDVKFDVNENKLLFQNLIRKNSWYSFDSLSEGEKRTLHILMVIELLDEKSTVIIDEPEVHLDVSTLSKFWNFVIKENRNKKFVFISHSQQLIFEHKNNADFFSVNKINSNLGFSIIKIDPQKAFEDKSFENQIFKSIFAPTKKIIFCEGTNNSLDNKIYKELFKNDIVVPLGSCDNVSKAIDFHNNNKEFIYNGFIEYLGIIDSDNKITKLKDNLKVTLYHEVESLILDDDILEAVIKEIEPNINELEIKLKIARINDLLLKYFEKNLDTIVSKYMQEHKTFFQQKNSWIFDFKKDNWQEDILNLKNLYYKSYNDKEKELKNAANQIIKSKDKHKFLNFYNLKSKIYQVINSELDIDFKKNAILVIKKNDDLRKKLKNKFFISNEKK